MLKLNKTIRSANSVECKLKIRSIPIYHLRFVGVHVAAHANVERKSIATSSRDLGSSQTCHRAQSANVKPELEQQEDQECGAQQFGSRETQYGDLQGATRLDENIVDPDDDCRLQSGQRRGCPEKKNSRRCLVTGCKGLHDAMIHK